MCMDKRLRHEEIETMNQQSNKTYTINDIAQMTMLSDRTIRNYIRRGLLKGKLNRGTWYFTEEELGAFFKEDYVKQTTLGKAEGIVTHFLDNDKRDEDSICAIYDMVIRTEEEGNQICEKLLLEINAEDNRRVTYSYQYNGKKGTVRIIVSGDADKVTELLMSLKRIN